VTLDIPILLKVVIASVWQRYRLTASETGTLFIFQSDTGGGPDIINLPQISTNNVGIWYEFFVNVTTTNLTHFQCPVNGKIIGNLDLNDGSTSANNTLFAEGANASLGGITGRLVLQTATLRGGIVNLLCIADNGANTTWLVTASTNPRATIN